MRRAAEEPSSGLDGCLLANRYHLRDRLGKGGMAYVYRAEDSFLGREVAIKVLSEECATHDVAMKRFVREARTMAALDSAHVVPLYDVGKDGPHTFLVMKLMDAPTLDHIIQREGRLAPGRAARLMAQVLDGLGHLHEKGVVHRDVKPSNVLVDGSDYAMLLDLGIAFDPTAAGLTADGIILGTPSYISPEQVAGTPVDGRSDLYSAGVVLFEALTGELPFLARTQVEACLMHLKRPPPSPRELEPSISEAVARVVLKALEKKPDRRFATARAMREALLEAAGESLAAMSQPVGGGGPPERITPPGAAGSRVGAAGESAGPPGPAVQGRAIDPGAPPRLDQPPSTPTEVPTVRDQDALPQLVDAEPTPRERRGTVFLPASALEAAQARPQAPPAPQAPGRPLLVAAAIMGALALVGAGLVWLLSGRG